MIDFDLLLDALDDMTADEFCHVERYIWNSLGLTDTGPFDEEIACATLARLTGGPRRNLIAYLEALLPQEAETCSAF